MSSDTSDEFAELQKLEAARNDGYLQGMKVALTWATDVLNDKTSPGYNLQDEARCLLFRQELQKMIEQLSTLKH